MLNRLYFVRKNVFAILLLVFMAGILGAAPHNGEKFDLEQPDGSLVTVLVWGDEYHQDVEGLDGYTLIRDPVSDWICYADLSADGHDYISTGIIYTLSESGTRGSDSGSNPVSYLKKHLRISGESRLTKAYAVREDLNNGVDVDSQPLPTPKTATRAITGKVVGLTVLVDFSDQKSSISKEVVDDFCNKPGYGQYGSVKDYFSDISGKKLIYENVVTTFIRADRPKSFYDSADGGKYKTELITYIFNQLKKQKFNFGQLSASGGSFRAVNIFYAGSPKAGWGKGLWPHMGYYKGKFNADGVKVYRYQMTGMGTSLKLGTFAHENGHMVCKFPDLYAYDKHDYGIGKYGLMCTQNSVNPQMPNPYFRYLAGWIELVDITTADKGQQFSHLANSNSAYIYKKKSDEFFLIEARRKKRRSATLPDEGLAVWHIFTKGDNKTKNKQNLVALEQADGLFHLENRKNSGGSGDLFHGGYRDKFNGSTNPNSKYYNKAASGLNISNIGPVADTMSFKIGDTSTGTAQPTKEPVNTPIPTRTPVPGNIDPFSRIEAEDFTAQSGQLTISSFCQPHVGNLISGSWLQFMNVNFGNGAGSFTANITSGGDGGTIEIRLDKTGGRLIGTCQVQNTGGWCNYQEFSCNVNRAQGKHDLFLIFKNSGSGHLFDIDYFSFKKGSSTTTPTPSPIPSPVPTAKPTEVPTPTKEPQLKGDLDKDGDINIIDALLLAKCYVNLGPCPNLKIGDIDCNGVLNIVDALLLAQYYVKIIDTLEC